MKQIICLANQPWSDVPSRAQQLMSRMRDAKILYFAPDTGGKPVNGLRVRPNITVYTLPRPILSHIHPRMEQFNWNRKGKYIAKIAKKHHFRRPLLWTTNPKHSNFLPQIDHSALIYDCNQEWDELPIQWEGQLANLADIIFVASKGLKERLSPCNPNIALIPNGVNFPLFAAVNPPPPSNRPVFGWVGRITPDLNLSPLLFAARSRPHWRFMLVGEQVGTHPLMSQLERLPNVKFLPSCSLAEVPNRLAVCHVLMDFQRQESAGCDIVPRRIYEYLCTGAPIVSLLLPDQVELFPDVIYGAHNDTEFLRMCESALVEAPGFVRERRIHYGEAASWAERASEIIQILDTTGFL